MQFYTLGDNAVKNGTINITNDAFQQPAGSLLKVVENSVTKQSKPTVYSVHSMLMHFGSLTQFESIQSYLVCLNSVAVDCETACLECCFDLVPMNVKDKFICGLFNSTLHSDIFAKTAHLKTLEDVVKHEAFKTALHEQFKLTKSPIPTISCASDYCQQNQTTSTRPQRPCGSASNGSPESNDCSFKCPAWVKYCFNYNIPNHFSQVCRKKTNL